MVGDFGEVVIAPEGPVRSGTKYTITAREVHNRTAGPILGRLATAGICVVYGRFAIETTCRQMNQARIRTCTRDPLWRLLLVAVVTVHGLGTGSFFGPLRAEKCACPLPAQGDSPIFADFVAKIGTVPVNGYCDWTSANSVLPS